MGSFLLISDTHWDDNPQNCYRWNTFERLREVAKEYSVDHIFHLGDAVDRKDRHSAQFVNQLIGELIEVSRVAPLTILRGNHDSPLTGPSFWKFLNELRGAVSYIEQPTSHGNVLLLPFTPDPIADWRRINFSAFRAAFMHITVTGAISESGYVLTGGKMPILPRSMILYSGDVHNPQTVRNLTYVGCPHPIKFGDRFQPRMLLLNADTLEISSEVLIRTVRKLVVEAKCLDDLRNMTILPGDQLRVRMSLSPLDVDRWGEMEGEIAEWISEAGAILSGTEVVVDIAQNNNASVGLDRDPEELLRQFASEESISDELLQLGVELMREAS